MNRKSILILFGFLLFATFTYAQKIIKGKVTDVADGTGIPGVSVLVKGTSSGTTTQPDGSYAIDVPASGTTLIFKYLGFDTQEITIGDKTVINAILSSSSQTLEGVVVTALGIKRSEKSVGYATQTVKGDNLTLTKEQNVIGSLAGKIDYGNVSQDINPEDIESVSVLKGPAASALYGIRGQYGVILITTKKGSKGTKKVNISVNSAFSIEKTANFLELQNIYGVGNNQTFLTLTGGQKYVNGNDESWGPKMDGTPVRMFYSFYPQDPEFGQLTPFVPHPDNIKDFYETGHNINNGITVTGGSENIDYRISYNNAYVNGVIPNTWLKRNNLGLSSSLKITDKLSVGANVNYANNNGQRPTQGYQGSFTGATQWFQRNIDIDRLRNYKYADGTILNWNVNPNTATGIVTNNKPSDWNNPFFDAYEVLNNDNRDRLFGDVNATYQVLPELKLSGFVRSDMFTQNITHKEPLGGRLVDSYQIGKYQNEENNYEFLGQYAKTLNDISLNFNVGANLYTVKYSQQYQATVGGLSSPGWYSAAASIDRPISTSFLRRKQVRSVYAMGSIGYKDTYFLDASIRNDVSSALPNNNNSYWYPSVSGSFVFSELVKWKALSFGKLRASYAIAGSDLSPYQTAFTYGPGSNYPATAGAINTLLVPDKLKNPNIKPSFANSFEVGMDLKFLKNRLGLELTYYNQENKDQIIDLSVSGASGFDQTVVNAGLIQNKGVELSLTGRPIQSKLFTWDATLNFARNKNKIVELYPGISVLQNDLNTYSSQTIYLNSTVGRTFGNLIGPGYKIDPGTGKVLLGADNMPLFDAAKDFGSVLPDFTGGFQNTFKIWKFDLGAMIDFQKGGQFMSWSKMLSAKSGQAAETAAINDKGFNVRDAIAAGGGVKVNGISQATGQEVTAYVDARTYYRTNLGTRIYDEWIYSASYVKLREVSLGYNFDGKVLAKTPFKTAKLSVIARNPVMIWQKAPKGVDPSELSSGSSSISWIEKGELQTVRSFGVNLNLTF
ncbi:MAG: SusC/RagA family TonB-linked outer membrane protein [Pedobacter sp.]|nr:MAG: SusC/RagA family TonB-linked outer membrane protein [Pedobacter sp.]